MFLVVLANPASGQGICLQPQGWRPQIELAPCVEASLPGVALDPNRIPLGQGSIELDLEGSDPGALRGDDFRRPPQMLQQLLRIPREII
jgi:hypothetical protein